MKKKEKEKQEKKRMKSTHTHMRATIESYAFMTLCTICKYMFVLCVACVFSFIWYVLICLNSSANQILSVELVRGKQWSIDICFFIVTENKRKSRKNRRLMNNLIITILYMPFYFFTTVARDACIEHVWSLGAFHGFDLASSFMRCAA